MKNKLSKNEESELCRMYQQNLKTIQELSIQYKITNTSICNYLKRNNIRIKLGKDLNLNKEDIINLYLKENLDIVSIAKKFYVNPSSIYRILIKNNIIIKNNSKTKQKYEINECYFNHIDTESKSYFLGLIYADGCLSNCKYQMKISLQKNDKNILETFIKELQYSGNLKQIDRYNKINPSYKIQYQLTISNKQIYTDLIKLGVFSNKSLNLIFPNNQQVPEHLIKHFILGYFDGDGCITKTPNNQKYMSFLGTYEFLNKIKDYFFKNNLSKKNTSVNNVKNSKIFIFKIGGNKQIANIYKHFYDNSTIFFNRKKIKFEI